MFRSRSSALFHATLSALLFCAVLGPLLALAQVAGPAAPPANLGAEISKLLIQTVLPILATGLTGLVGWGIKLGMDWLKAQTSSTQLQLVTDRVEHLAQAVVADLEVTLAAQVREAAADGRITGVEAEKLRAVALERMRGVLAEQGMQEVQGVLGLGTAAVDTYLRGILERAVSNLPMAKRPLPPLAGAPLRAIPLDAVPPLAPDLRESRFTS